MATVVFKPTEELSEYHGFDYADERGVQPISAIIPLKYDEKNEQWKPSASSVELEVTDETAARLVEDHPSNFSLKK